MKRKWRMWDWICPRCGNVGSTPVDLGTSADDSVLAVHAHHTQVAPACGLAGSVEGSRVEVLKITTYRQMRAGAVVRKVAGS